jgi:hypothetical protein
MVARRYGQNIAEDAVGQALEYVCGNYDPERISAHTNAPIKPFTLLYKAAFNSAYKIVRSKWTEELDNEFADPLVEQEMDNAESDVSEEMPWVQKLLDALDIESVCADSPQEKARVKYAKKVTQALAILVHSMDDVEMGYGDRDELNIILSEMSGVPFSNMANAMVMVRKVATRTMPYELRGFIR